MTLYYLDASAWVKRYCREAGSERVRGLFARENVLCCATLGYIEVMATLTRKRRAGEIDGPLWEGARRLVRSDWDRFCHVELSAAVRETALRVAEASALRGADAVHLASALVLRDRLPPAPDEVVFVAWDRELREAAARAGFPVIDPEEQ